MGLLYKITCVCGVIFTGNTKARKYCDACREAKEAPKPGYNPTTIVEKECDFCEKPFKSGRKNAKFCSRDCKEKNKNWRHRNPGFESKRQFIREKFGY